MCQVSTPVLWAGAPICLRARNEAGVADEDILSNGDKEADVAAVEAANGAAACRAAVAAAGASEMASAAAAVSQA